MAKPNNQSARRIGIWTVTIIVLVIALYGLIRLTQSSTPTIPPPSVSQVSSTDHTEGQGKTVLIEYADFQCPACKNYYPYVKDLIAKHSDQLTVVYRYFPLISIHPNAEAAAFAAEAAGKQGKFWEMHDQLYDNQDSWAESNDPSSFFQQYAKAIGINVDQFNTDAKSSAVHDRVIADEDSGNAAGINSTPTFYLNGQKLTPTSYDDFTNSVTGAFGK